MHTSVNKAWFTRIEQCIWIWNNVFIH